MLELGEVPLTIFAQKNAMKNWVRIVNKIQCNSMNINSHEKAVLHNFSWAVRIEITISEIGMRELFLMKEPQKFRMQDIFHHESFSEIRKEDGKLRTHGLFKDTIGIHYTQ